MKEKHTSILEEFNSEMAIGGTDFLKKQFFVLKMEFYSLNLLMTLASLSGSDHTRLMCVTQINL